MESGLVLLQTAMPLLALHLGASYIMLGTIGWVAQAIRTPICFTSGHISERVGRAKIIVPAALLCAAIIVALGHAKNNTQVIVLYAVAMAAIGVFYPPLQAMIGDVSERGQLRKNLGMFNVGWCVGGAVAAWVAGQLVGAGLGLLFNVGAGCCVVAAILVLTWRGKAVTHGSEDEESPEAVGEDFGPLLPIARMGHFVAFVGFSMIRILFPKLAIESFGWSEAGVAKAIAVFLWGLGSGILLTNVSAWWRGKLWPQIVSQLAMVICAAGVAAAAYYGPRLTLSDGRLLCDVPGFAIILGVCFFGFGMAQSIAYAGALYYGLSSRKGKGTNTGIHESLVAAGCVSGCLFGGLAAQWNAIAPFVLLAGLAGVALVVTPVIWARRPVSEPSA